MQHSRVSAPLQHGSSLLHMWLSPTITSLAASCMWWLRTAWTLGGSHFAGKVHRLALTSTSHLLPIVWHTAQASGPTCGQAASEGTAPLNRTSPTQCHRHCRQHKLEEAPARRRCCASTCRSACCASKAACWGVTPRMGERGPLPHCANPGPAVGVPSTRLWGVAGAEGSRGDCEGAVRICMGRRRGRWAVQICWGLFMFRGQDEGVLGHGAHLQGRK